MPYLFAVKMPSISPETTAIEHPPSTASIREAFSHCESVVRTHYENFPVGSRFVPGSLRPHVCSIYAFARAADDFADEPGLKPTQRLLRLKRMAEQPRRLSHRTERSCIYCTCRKRFGRLTFRRNCSETSFRRFDWT